MSEEKTIYDLKLNESMFFYTRSDDVGTNQNHILRVAGGWIYNHTVFVPFNNEFQQP